jgi:collagenase-like PrtC family protease
MPYGLVLNGSLVAAPDDAKYLLSPQVDMTTHPNHLSLTPFAGSALTFLSLSLLSEQDLSAIDLVPELIVAGVKSFKIEGRLKVPSFP